MSLLRFCIESHFQGTGNRLTPSPPLLWRGRFFMSDDYRNYFTQMDRFCQYLLVPLSGFLLPWGNFHIFPVSGPYAYRIAQIVSNNPDHIGNGRNFPVSTKSMPVRPSGCTPAPPQLSPACPTAAWPACFPTVRSPIGAAEPPEQADVESCPACGAPQSAGQ